MRTSQIKAVKQILHRGLSGTHMLAFLPALCLAAFWGGGEILLVTFALMTPLLYASTGGFGGTSGQGRQAAEREVSVQAIARDFLETSRQNGQTTACFQISVSGLDAISKSMGDETAAEAGKLVKARLNSTLRGGDYVFQISENRFVVLIAPGFRLKLDALIDLSKRLRASIEDPASVSGTTQFFSASIGIASSLNFARNTDADTWIKSAAHALGAAQSNGPSSTRVWSEELSTSVQSRRALREDLSNAVSNGQIQAYFQPQVSVRSGEVIGIEAIAHWEHPKHGIITPSEFACALTESGEMENLGKALLSQSIAALRRLDSAGFDVAKVNLKLSGVELRNPDLTEYITQQCDRTELPVHRLGIDVPDCVTTHVDDVIHHNLVALSENGCHISLVGFGNGHTSLMSLQTYPIRQIKIDQSLIKGADTHADKKRLLAATIGIADSLNLETLAEGVQTVEENGVLRDLGCTHAQGSLFANPMSIESLEEWLRAKTNTNDTASFSIRRVK